MNANTSCVMSCDPYYTNPSVNAIDEQMFDLAIIDAKKQPTFW